MGLRHDAQTDQLFRSILALKDTEECYLYFEDLCTNKEIRDMGQRLTIAQLLSRGSSYLQAAEALGVSSDQQISDAYSALSTEGDTANVWLGSNFRLVLATTG